MYLYIHLQYYRLICQPMIIVCIIIVLHLIGSRGRKVVHRSIEVRKFCGMGVGPIVYYLLHVLASVTANAMATAIWLHAMIVKP